MLSYFNFEIPKSQLYQIVHITETPSQLLLNTLALQEESCINIIDTVLMFDEFFEACTNYFTEIYTTAEILSVCNLNELNKNDIHSYNSSIFIGILSVIIFRILEATKYTDEIHIAGNSIIKIMTYNSLMLIKKELKDLDLNCDEQSFLVKWLNTLK